MPAYTSAAEILIDRIRWVTGCLARLVNEGRAAGWLEGVPLAVVDADELYARIEARIAKTPTDLRIAPMQWFAARLGLTQAELDLVWMLACIELDPGVARLAQVFGSSTCPDLSVQIVQRLAAVESKQLESLGQLGVIEVASDPRIPQHRRPVRINDRVLEIARGELRVDRELAGIATMHPASVSAETTAVLQRALSSSPAPLILATGPKGAGRASALASAAGSLGLGTLRVETANLSREPTLLERQLRAVVSEACLFDVVPLFVDIDGEHPPGRDIEVAFRTFSGPVLATARDTVVWTQRPVVAHAMEKPDSTMRAAIWRDQLVGSPDALPAAAAESYPLRPGAIVAAARNAIAISGGAVTAEAIHAGVRAQIGCELGTLATRVDCRQTWDDLALPTDQFEQILELMARARHRSTVLETWGFGAKIGRGHGLTALLSGPPGTGKTMVAGLAILLFDEADSLFAKRSEVKSSNDRYANLEVNYLLQRIETFTGICLLTTNHDTAIDTAFRRRLSVHVRFPLPDAAQRKGLWEAMVPEAAPVEANLDMSGLAREFAMSGGYIKNAMLRAAYLAADENTAISMNHLWRSARSEYEALGKISFLRAA